MPNNSIPEDSINQLQQIFRAHAKPAVKEWFENYLRGAISYYGLKTPDVRTLLKDWQKARGLASCSPEEQLHICSSLIALSYAEEKFAGIIYMESLVGKMQTDTLLEAAENYYRQGYFFDWSTADWFTVRVLAKIIQKHPTTTSRITAWTKADNLWQRRASVVTLRAITGQESSIPVIKRVIGQLLPDSRRFIQTGIGWTLSDLSKKFPTEAAQIIEQYFSQLSREVIDRHTKHLPQHNSYKKRKRSR